jgi:hypothetical protein
VCGAAIQGKENLMSEPAWPPRGELAPYFRPEMYIGAAFPLWGYFTGAAAAGVAYWWMTRWMRTGGLGFAVEGVTRPALTVIAEATADFEQLAEAAVEAVAEPAVEAVAEAFGGPVAMAFVSEEPSFPVGGESAPVAIAVLEAELAEDPSLADELTPNVEPPPAPKVEEPPPVLKAEEPKAAPAPALKAEEPPRASLVLGAEEPPPKPAPKAEEPPPRASLVLKSEAPPPKPAPKAEEPPPRASLVLKSEAPAPKPAPVLKAQEPPPKPAPVLKAQEPPPKPAPALKAQEPPKPPPGKPRKPREGESKPH